MNYCCYCGEYIVLGPRYWEADCLIGRENYENMETREGCEQSPDEHHHTRTRSRTYQDIGELTMPALPANTPKMDYNGIENWLQSDDPDRTSRLIGSTVMVFRPHGCTERFAVQLYMTVIAHIREDGVHFTPEGIADHHRTTTVWMTRIARDNGIGHTFSSLGTRYLASPNGTITQMRCLAFCPKPAAA